MKTRIPKIVLILVILSTQIFSFGQQKIDININATQEEGKGPVDKNGKKTGEWKLYYPNDSLRWIGQYEAGERTGEWKFYYQNGKLQTVGSYINGKQSGTVKEYEESGNLSTGRYENGLITGEWKTYDPKGNLSAVAHFQNGHAVGENIIFYENGKPFIINYFDKEGNITLEKKEYYPDGKIKYNSSYNKNKKLVTKFYNEKGKLVKTVIE